MARKQTASERIIARVEELMREGMTLEQATRKIAEANTTAYVTLLAARHEAKRQNAKRYR